ncbi:MULTISPECIES: hypothetical protein [Bartonella]|uniref:hypothetical protein n=1 Tax=Bartonella TaxID=773 RepID=UPI0018DE2D75|nr:MULTISPECIES: hypothetical protein [Bartonella]MBI0169873.1 hypothetical protein [Bartonella sp. W8167]MBI0176149.1 hypothetical protein [Bartonella apis]
MKFSLILEAVDKATKTISAVSKAEKTFNDSALRGAEKAANAYEKSAKAADKAAVASEKAAKAEQAHAAAGAKMEQLSANRVKGWRAEEMAVGRLNKVIERWINLQAFKGGRAGYRIGTGLTNIAGGGMSVGKYGALLGGGAIAAGSFAFAAGMSGAKEARKYQTLLIAMKGVTKSAEEAKIAMDWIEKAQLPPYGLEDLTHSYIQLKNVGIDPANGSLQNIADMAAGTGKNIDTAAKAYTGAIKGNLSTLKLFGITAKKNGKYVDYMFAGKDGRMKKYKAVAGNRSSNAAAIDKVVSARFGGSSAAFGKTWDGLMWKLTDAWDNAKLKIMNSGLFDFLTQKLDMVVSLIDRWGADGTIDRWCENISRDLIATMTVAWAVVEKLSIAGQAIFNVLDKISGYVGGWENMAIILLALPVVPALARMAMGFIQVAQGIGVFIGIGGKAIALFAQLNNFSRLGAAFRLLLTPIGLVTKSFITMGIAFMSTPLGWVVAAIAAIAAGAYLIYRNWDKIGPWFKNIWAKTKQIFADFWNWVKGLFSWDNVFTAINWFSYLVPIRWVEFIPGFPGWQTVISIFSWDNFLTVLSWLNYLSPLNWLDFIPDFPSWQNIIQSDTVQVVMNNIVKMFDDAKGKIQSVFTTIGGAWKFVKDLFSGGTKEAAVNIVAQDPAAISAANAEVEKLSGKLEALSAIDFSNTKAALTGLQDKTAETIAKAGGIERAFSVAISAARSVLAAANFESHGAALMRTFAIGIRNGAGSAIAATRDVVGQIRDYLPHSPAKRGPLSDLNRVRFSETLAKAIKPAPAIAAVERVTSGMRNALSGPFSSTINPMRPALSAGLPAGGNNGGHGTVSINYAPVINVAGNASSREMGDVMRQALAELQAKLPSMLDKVAAAKKRREY